MAAPVRLTEVICKTREGTTIPDGFKWIEQQYRLFKDKDGNLYDFVERIEDNKDAN